MISESIILLTLNQNDFPVLFLILPLTNECIPLFGEDIALIYLKIIYFVDDRKAVIAYAITIAVSSLFSEIYLDTRKEPEKWLS